MKYTEIYEIDGTLDENKTAVYDQFAEFSSYGSNVFVTAPGYVNVADRTNASATGHIFAESIVAEFQGYESGNSTTLVGTSFSAPLVSGVLALATEAMRKNPNYQPSWESTSANTRLMKHLMVRTSTKIDNDRGWDEATETAANYDARKYTTNAAGHSFSATYGFGQINAEEMVNAASKTLGVTEQTVASATWYNSSTDTDWPSNVTITDVNNTEILKYTGTIDIYSEQPIETNTLTSNYTYAIEEDWKTAALGENVSVNNVEIADPVKTMTIAANFDQNVFDTANIDVQALEEVSITLALDTANLGGLQLELTSPSGTKNILAFQDTNGEQVMTDIYGDGYLEWTFSTNAFWGEDPLGEWLMTISDFSNADSNYSAYSDFFQIHSIASTFYMGQELTDNPTPPTPPTPGNPVPEPGTWVLMVTMAVGLWIVRRRRFRV